MRAHRDCLRRELLGWSRRSGFRPHHSHRPSHRNRRTFILQCIYGRIRELPYGSSPCPGHRFGRLPCTPIRIFDSFRLGCIHVLQHVIEGLILGYVNVGKLLQDRRKLRKILQLQRDIRVYAIAHQLAFWRFEVINGLQGEKAYFGKLRLDAVRAQNLTYLLCGSRCAIIGRTRGLFLY